MSARRSLTVLLLLAVGVSFTGCGSDDKGQAKTTTTVKAEESGGSDTTLVAPQEDPEPTTTISADELDASIADLQQQLTDAGDDFCKVVEVARGLTGQEPTTSAQAEALYKLLGAVFTRIAETMPAGNETDAATIKAAAAKMLEEAAANGYDPSGGMPEAMNDPAMTTAMSNVGVAITKSCPGVMAEAQG